MIIYIFKTQNKQLENERWFAWFPVLVSSKDWNDSGTNMIAWLEYVNRKQSRYVDGWWYSEISEEKE